MNFQRRILAYMRSRQHYSLDGGRTLTFSMTLPLMVRISNMYSSIIIPTRQRQDDLVVVRGRESEDGDVVVRQSAFDWKSKLEQRGWKFESKEPSIFVR